MTEFELAAKVPAWLSAKIDQRLALLMEVAMPLVTGEHDALFTFLTDPKEDTDEALALWENSCDCCGGYFPGDLNTGRVEAKHPSGLTIVIGFGACDACKEVD